MLPSLQSYTTRLEYSELIIGASPVVAWFRLLAEKPLNRRRALHRLLVFVSWHENWASLPPTSLLT
jgi:hypothetical protein